MHWIRYIKKDKELLALLIKSDTQNFPIIMQLLNEYIKNNSYNNIKPSEIYNEAFYNLTKNNIATYYNLNSNNLDKIINKFGYTTIHFIETKNIKNIINLDEKKLEKLLNLFPDNKLTIDNIQNIYDSIIQTRFKIEHKEDIERFQRIKNTIINDTYPLPLEDLTILSNNIDINNITKTKRFTNYQIEQLKTRPLEYLIECYNNIKNNKDVDKNIDIIYEIHKQYLKIEREKYRANHDYHKEIKLSYTYDEKSLVNSLIKDLALGTKELITEEQLYEVLKSYDEFKTLNSLSNPTKENIIKIKECLKFLKSSSKEYNNKETIKNINNLKDILKVVIKKGQYFDYNLESCCYDIKKIYYPEHDENNIFNILKNINLKELEDTVFNNNDIYIYHYKIY